MSQPKHVSPTWPEQMPRRPFTQCDVHVHLLYLRPELTRCMTSYKACHESTAARPPQNDIIQQTIVSHTSHPSQATTKPTCSVIMGSICHRWIPHTVCRPSTRSIASSLHNSLYHTGTYIVIYLASSYPIALAGLMIGLEAELAYSASARVVARHTSMHTIAPHSITSHGMACKPPSHRQGKKSPARGSQPDARGVRFVEKLIRGLILEGTTAVLYYSKVVYDRKIWKGDGERRR
jgi:hypothetical protein